MWLYIIVMIDISTTAPLDALSFKTALLLALVSQAGWRVDHSIYQPELLDA